jgi:glycosyltransferase involved in cell wall biosynthesis
LGRPWSREGFKAVNEGFFESILAKTTRGLVISSNHPMHVLLWSPKGSSEQYHGPGSFAYRMYSLADPQEAQVTLVHSKSQQPEIELFAQQHYIQGGGGLRGTLEFLHRAKRWLAAHAKSYDVFHGLTGYHLTIKPAYQAHQLGLPAVVFIATHGQELTDKPGVRRLLGWPRKRRQMIRELDGVIAMSTAIYDELIEFGVEPRRIARIPMGVNADRFRPASGALEKSALRRQLGLQDRPTLLFVGAIIHRKQPHLLVHAVERSLRQGLDCQLVLVGPADEPDYEREIIEWIRQMKLGEHVKLVGHTPQIELYFRAADLFALPALSEGMPAALLEAMSSGLPCLGTPISGISDLIQDGLNGRIVQPEVESLVKALTEYLRQPSMVAEHGQRGRAQIVEGYGAERVLRGYLDLFRCVMDGRDASDASTLPKRG